MTDKEKTIDPDEMWPDVIFTGRAHLECIFACVSMQHQQFSATVEHCDAISDQHLMKGHKIPDEHALYRNRAKQSADTCTEVLESMTEQSPGLETLVRMHEEMNAKQQEGSAIIMPNGATADEKTH